jgi:hypothetical protein
MIEKRFLGYREVAGLVPHYPELDMDKLGRIVTRTTTKRGISNQKTGQTEYANVLAVPPLLLRPSVTVQGRWTILNGKHRAVIAVLRRVPLEVAIVSSRNSIPHHVPRVAFGDLDIERIQELYDEAAKWETLCVNQGVGTVLDLMRKSSDALGDVILNNDDLVLPHAHCKA